MKDAVSVSWSRGASPTNLIAVGCIAITLAACGGGSDNAPSTPTPPPAPPVSTAKVAVPASAASATACDAAALSVHLPSGTGATLAITSAVATLAPVPYCRVRGTITTQLPNPNTVNFSLSLPDTYSGRYAYEAPGGSAGSVGNPQAALLEKGYAVATGDQGTRPAFGLDFRWRSDPAQLLDYNHRGVHNTALVTQALTKWYYNRPNPVRYLLGCSGGGRSVRNNARIYGTQDFDGFLGSAPPSVASNTLMMGRIAQYISRNPSSWIPPALMLAGDEHIVATYDAADGVTDGIIQDERLFHFNSQILLNVGFTQPQIALVEFVRASYAHLSEPAPTANGGRTPGFPITRLREWTSWLVGSQPPSAWSAGVAGTPNSFNTADSTLRAIHGDSYDWITNFDFSNPLDFQRWTTGTGDNAGGAGYDYTRLRDGGGKAIFYTGMGASAQSFKETLVTLREMAVFTPNVEQYSKTYFVSGWGHCGPSGAGGAPAAEVQHKFLDAIIAWVETNTAPGSVPVVRPVNGAVPQRTFLLCPEPQVAVFNGGAADFNLVENWSCQAKSLPQLFP